MRYFFTRIPVKASFFWCLGLSLVLLLGSFSKSPVVLSQSNENVFGILENYLSKHSAVFGAALAFNPQIQKASPFVFRGKNGLERTDIANSIDYTTAVWYDVPVKQKKAVWSDPYFDVGGAGEDVALTTYSIPLFDTKSQLTAVVTNDLLLATVNNLKGQKSAIENAIEGFSKDFNPDQNGDGKFTDEDTSKIFARLENYLSGSPAIFGSTLAFNPAVVKASPFVFRGKNGLERTNIADSIDYTTTVWYKEPVELGKAVWSSPYFDVGGAGEDVLLTTYSTPLFNKTNSSLIGVLTSDLLLGRFESGKIKSQRTSIQDTAVGLAKDVSSKILNIPFPSTR